MPGVRLKDLRRWWNHSDACRRRVGQPHVFPATVCPRAAFTSFPMPPKAGDPAMDCHWSSLNFFNEQPDDRLGNPGYAAGILTKNYYPVQNPPPTATSSCWWMKNNGMHSAVYVADDIVFTKNGNNHQQPRMLMRTENLIARYNNKGDIRALVCRQKSS